MSRTNIDLDDALVAEVIPLSRDFLLSLEGVGWEESLDDIRRERPNEL